MRGRQPQGVCCFCKREIGPAETSAVPVTGWAVQRAVGGTNALVGKKQVPDVIAHAVCVKLKSNNEKFNISDAQISFLDY